MHPEFQFTYLNLKQEYLRAIESGYKIITCEEYFNKKKSATLKEKTIVNRVDVDYSVKKAEKLAEIFSELDIKATFFLRLHAPEYNPLSFENYRIIKKIISLGNEIGYHSEVIDQAHIWKEDAEHCLRKDIAVMNSYFGISIKGAASHGGFTGLNNLDFWKCRKPKDFGLLYEGYDREPEFNLFHESRYISDSEWIRWKSYENGTLRQNDRRSLSEHIKDQPKIIYLLIHPDTYFTNHFYE